MDYLVLTPQIKEYLFRFNMKKAIVALSGGVDSTVAAYLLKEEGYDILAITMLVIPDYIKYAKKRNEQLIYDSKKAAEKLNIEHKIIDLRDEFEDKVIKNFGEEYKKGRTPNPCVICNRDIKLGLLVEEALKYDPEIIVTGHYSQIENINGEYIIKMGKDKKKDQSYFLYGINKDYLKYLKMPLKDLSKEEVRKIAEKIDLEISKKPDSSEICFIPDEDYKRFLKEDLNIKTKKGNFIDEKGSILGLHEGIDNYTIGQRRGLNISLGKRAYVTEIKTDTNEIVLGDENDLYNKNIIVKNLNFLVDDINKFDNLKAKIRSTALAKPVDIELIGEDELKITFKEKERAITKGQSVVLYNNERLIGGGIIEEVF